MTLQTYVLFMVRTSGKSLFVLYPTPWENRLDEIRKMIEFPKKCWKAFRNKRRFFSWPFFMFFLRQVFQGEKIGKSILGNFEVTSLLPSSWNLSSRERSHIPLKGSGWKLIFSSSIGGIY